MSSTLFRSRRTERLLTVFVLVGVTSFAWARVRTAESRTLPYQGVLERDGTAVSGPVTARFGLFNAPNANTACVASNSCPLWSDEVDIDVVDGRFSVLLGEGAEPLTSAILSSPQLFLGVAFKTDDDAAFTALTSTQEVIGAPMVQPGVVPAPPPDTLFTAVISGGGGITSSAPAGWIDGGSIDGSDGGLKVTHQLHTGGVTQLNCTATPSSANPRFVSLQTVTTTTLVHRTFLNGGGGEFIDIRVICVGF